MNAVTQSAAGTRLECCRSLLGLFQLCPMPAFFCLVYFGKILCSALGYTALWGHPAMSPVAKGWAWEPCCTQRLWQGPRGRQTILTRVVASDSGILLRSPHVILIFSDLRWQCCLILLTVKLRPRESLPLDSSVRIVSGRSACYIHTWALLPLNSTGHSVNPQKPLPCGTIDMKDVSITRTPQGASECWAGASLTSSSVFHDPAVGLLRHNTDTILFAQLLKIQHCLWFSWWPWVATRKGVVLPFKCLD